MYYLDTSVLISYIFTSDINHKRSKNALESIASKGDKLYISQLALLEMHNVTCRKMLKEGVGGMIRPPQWNLGSMADYEARCRSLLFYMIGFLNHRLGVELVGSSDLYGSEAFSIGSVKLEMPRVFWEALSLSTKLNIKTLDLLHLAYASMLSKSHSIKFFVTCDIENFGRIRDKVKQLLGIEILLII